VICTRQRRPQHGQIQLAAGHGGQPQQRLIAGRYPVQAPLHQAL
jgi:hypothetical protein